MTLKIRIKETENENSDLKNADDNGKEKSHFQLEETYLFQGMHQTTGVLQNKIFMFNKTFEK